MVGKVGFCNTDGIDDQLHLSLLNGPCIARDDPTEGIASACSLRTQGFSEVQPFLDSPTSSASMRGRATGRHDAE